MATSPIIKPEIEYVTQQVARWIAAGDMVEEHAELAVAAVCEGFALRDVLGRPDVTLQQWCEIYHVALKSQETMDPKEYARKKRWLQKARATVRRWS
jgi:hypothetical protein